MTDDLKAAERRIRRQALADAWDEGRDAQRAYSAQTASVIIRWPEQVEGPNTPVNPYREESDDE